jgi:hypothetical protein
MHGSSTSVVVSNEDPSLPGDELVADWLSHSASNLRSNQREARMTMPSRTRIVSNVTTT